MLKYLEKLVKDYDIPLATIDGKAVAALANKRPPFEITDLVLCCLDTSDILKVLTKKYLFFWLFYQIENQDTLTPI